MLWPTRGCETAGPWQALVLSLFSKPEENLIIDSQFPRKSLFGHGGHERRHRFLCQWTLINLCQEKLCHVVVAWSVPLSCSGSTGVVIAVQIGKAWRDPQRWLFPILKGAAKCVGSAPSLMGPLVLKTR